jgi:hypothetical protein
LILFDFLPVAIRLRTTLSYSILRRPVAIPVAKFGARNLSIERREETSEQRVTPILLSRVTATDRPLVGNELA